MSTTDQQSELFRRQLGFAVFLLGTVILFWTFLKSLFHYSLTCDIATHIVLIVPISACFIYLKTWQIVSKVETGMVPSSRVAFVTGMRNNCTGAPKPQGLVIGRNSVRLAAAGCCPRFRDRCLEGGILVIVYAAMLL